MKAKVTQWVQLADSSEKRSLERLLCLSCSCLLIHPQGSVVLALAQACNEETSNKLKTSVPGEVSARSCFCCALAKIS